MLIKELPKSNATTVRELLNDVKQAILEEPKRANMGCFVYTKDEQTSLAQAKEMPSCGTVGCFAGWISLLAGYSPDSRRVQRQADNLAQDILGHDLQYSFFGNDRYGYRQSFDYFNSGEGDGLDRDTPKRGTRAYARLVIKRINRFIRDNADKLDRPFNSPSY